MLHSHRLHWVLRVGVASEFIGHGLAGLSRPAAWIPYFGLFGFSEGVAHDHLMYIVGGLDVVLGVLVLVRPMRAVLLHMFFWGLLTAALRPLTDESFFELVERGANYGLPLAFFLLARPGTWSPRSWFERIRPGPLDDRLTRQLAWVMRASIALLLIGHGGLGIWAHKKEWFDFFDFFGIDQATVTSAHLSQFVGWFEVGLGLAVLLRPVRSLLVFVLAWKVGTELLRPLVGQPNYQFIERGGDYALPIALLMLMGGLAIVGRTARTGRTDGRPALQPMPRAGSGHGPPPFIQV